jgi:hypothetical protein
VFSVDFFIVVLFLDFTFHFLFSVKEDVVIFTTDGLSSSTNSLKLLGTGLALTTL